MSDLLFDQLLVPFFIRFFFVFGLIGLIVGLGQIAAPQRMHHVFEVLNRWISVRHGMKWLEAPYDVDTALHSFFRRTMAFILALVAYSTFVLAVQVNAENAVAALRIDNGNQASIALIMLEALRWFLVAGGFFVLAVGIVLIFFPAALSAFERRANHWYSSRNWLRGLDVMHMGFDTWARSHPRAMGSLIAAGAFVVSFSFGGMLFVRH
jgi:hypothetical protein